MDTTGLSDALVFVGADPHLRRQLQALAAERGLAVVEAAGDPGGEAPVVVVDLGLAGGLQAVRAWRARSVDTVVAAYLAVPDRGRWEEAERAGADLVVNRGALVRALRRLLHDLGPDARRRRFPLLDAAEVAGRLGLIGAVGTTPVGPLAVYRAGRGLVAVEDRCPHAGACLSQGALQGGVLTCPGHGSQFLVATGERIRGPADQGLRCYPAVEEAGRVWLVWT